MSKRLAIGQITRETFDRSEDDERDDEPVRFGVASSNVMSKRKIAMPKKKMEFKMPNTNSAESQMASAFDFGGKKQETKSNDEDDDKFTKLKALNSQFRNKINTALDRDSMADLSPVLNKYKQYIEDIKANGKMTSLVSDSEENNGKDLAVSKPVKKADFVKTGSISQPTAIANKKDSSSSSDEEEDEKPKVVKVEGPKFNMTEKPTTKRSAFVFGKTLEKRAQQEQDSDSEDEVKVEGPQFTFSGAVSGGAFKLPSKKVEVESKKPAENQATFSFTKKSDDTSATEVNKAPSNPFFSSNTPSTTTADSAAKPSFSFGTQSNQTQQSDNNETKPAASSFTFSKPASDKKNEQTSAFTFNPISTSKDSVSSSDSSKPAGLFKFGSTDNTNKPLLGSTPEDKPSTPAQGFSFKPNESKDKPSFGMNLGSTTDQQKSNDNVAKISFGNKSEETDANKSTQDEKSKSAFSFNFGPKKSEDVTAAGKPTFNFGSSTKTEVSLKPSFNFGSSQTSNAPSFSFQKPAESSSTSEKLAIPSNGFKFNLPFGQQPSNNSSPALEQKENKELSEASTDNVAEDEGDNEKTPNLSESQNGEENENALFSQRAKLMTFNTETKAYDSKGVGELKLLQDKEDKSKVRLLCRSDGMGHILLNSRIVEKFTFTALSPDKENLVKAPIIDSEGKLTTYIVKFKQKSDGRQFIKSVEDVKKDM